MKANSTSTRRQHVPVQSNVRAVSLRQAAGGFVRSTLRLMGGAERQEKICCRCCSAVVVVAPATRSSIGHVGLHLFRLQTMPKSELGSRKHTTKSRACTKGSRARPTSRAHSVAGPGLVCPTSAAAAAAVEEVLL